MSVRRRQMRLALASVALAAAVALSSGLGTDGAAGQAGSPLLTIGVDVKSATSAQVTYAIVVRNHGSGTASAIQVDNAVPANTRFKEATPAPTTAACQNGGPEEAAGTCGWALPNLAPGGEATIDATFALDAATANYTVTDTATLTANGVAAVSNADASLKRDLLSGMRLDDTYVDDSKAANTAHGRCPKLEISRDGSRTAFITPQAQSSQAAWPLMQRLWGAQLRAFVGVDAGQPAGTPSTLGLHRIETRWATAPGACGGITQVTDEPRTGWRPPSSVTPTAVASYSGRPAAANGDRDLLVWDVLSDVSTQALRESFEGWEVLDEGRSGSAVSLLQSGEAAANQPALAIVYTKTEKATCIDVDPDAGTLGSHHEAILTAHVTDGTKVSSEGNDGCNGGPAGLNDAVAWSIEDDDPDTYISSVNGVTASLHANSAAGTVNEDGRGTLGIRMAEPSGTIGADAGSTRISAGAPFGADPDMCSPTPGQSCPSESDVEDDAAVSWTFEPAPPPPPPDDDGSTGGSGSPAGVPVEQGLQAFTQRRVVWGRSARIAGRVESAAIQCLEGAKVHLLVRGSGGTRWATLSRVESDPTGTFELETIVRRRAEYRLSVPSTTACAGAAAGPFALSPVGRVGIGAGQLALRRRERTKIFGRVLPRSRGTRVVLQRATARGWKRVRRTRLNRRSRYSFTVEAAWLGTRTFRARWAGSPKYSPAVSRRVRLLSRRG